MATLPTQPTILIDSRERQPLKFANLPTETKGLATADYSAKHLEDFLLIERKSISDLIGSLFSKERPRFERELLRMMAVPSRHLFIVGEHGQPSPKAEIESHNYRSQTAPHVVLASVSSIQAKGIQVHWLDNPEEAAKSIESLVFYAWRSSLKRAGITPPKTPQTILKPDEANTLAT